MESTTRAEDYACLMRIENEDDAKEFVKERILNNMLFFPLYDSHDFRFPSSRYVKALNQEHEKITREQIKEDKKNKKGIIKTIHNGWNLYAPYQKRLAILYTAMAKTDLWHRAWIDNRYNLGITVEDIKAQAVKEQLATIDDEPFTPEQEAMIYWLKVRELYRWENVDRETGEITELNTGLYFLVDKDTGEEPFLQPGQVPYTPTPYPLTHSF